MNETKTKTREVVMNIPEADITEWEERAREEGELDEGESLTDEKMEEMLGELLADFFN